MAPHVDPRDQRFAALVSHHLRTPLHVLDDLAIRLEAGATARQRRQVASLRATIRHVIATLDDLLAEAEAQLASGCPPRPASGPDGDEHREWST
jgi:signal transduction histidine kinase